MYAVSTSSSAATCLSKRPFFSRSSLSFCPIIIFLVFDLSKTDKFKWKKEIKRRKRKKDIQKVSTRILRILRK
jgi:hypothetical protein